MLRPSAPRRGLLSALLVLLVAACATSGPTPSAAPATPSSSDVNDATPSPSPSELIPNGSPAAPTLEPAPPTSEDLIAEGLERGAIDYPTSLLYRVYAAFGSPALPAEYRSAVIDVHAATFVLNEIDEHVSELTPEVAGALAPYLVRPNDPASIFSSFAAAEARLQASAPPTPLKPVDKWASRPAAGGKARVWTPDSELADALLEMYAGEVDSVWPKVFSLTREPTPDQAGEPLASVNPDSAIDLYFVDLGTIDPRIWACHTDPASEDCTNPLSKRGGFTRAAKPKGERTSSAYVVIDTAAKGPELDANIAHELTHASQFTYDRLEDEWLLDSTATWAEYRTLQLLALEPTPEYEFLPAFFAGLDLELTRNDADRNRYGSWLYYMSLQIDRGDQLLPPIFEGMAADDNQGARAVDAVFPFQANFGLFALSNWNRDTADRYQENDATFPTTHRAAPDYNATVHPGEDRVEFETGPLSADYASFTFADDVQQVKFRNPLDPAAASVWLIANTRGTWHEPVEVIGEREFCFSRPDQDLDQLVVIVANPAMSGGALPPESMPTISATDEECELGDAFGSIVWTFTDESSNPNVPETSNLREQVAVNVRLAATEDGWEDDGSSYSWTGERHSRSQGRCPSYTDETWQGNDSFAANEEAYINFGLDDPGDGTTPTAYLHAWVQGELTGHYHSEVYNDLTGSCDVAADYDFSQGGAEWVQEPYCEYAGDGLTGRPSADGSTYDFSCSFTDSGVDDSGGSFHTEVNVSGSITVLRGPNDR